MHAHCVPVFVSCKCMKSLREFATFVVVDFEWFGADFGIEGLTINLYPSKPGVL
jgi:hypothetical protein